MIAFDHKFKEIDYNNLTYNDIVKFKLSLIHVLSQIEKYTAVQQYQTTYEWEGFIEATNGAYGYLHNPYSDVISSIYTMKSHLENIRDNISEYWLLENIDFKGKKQTFNTNLILGIHSYNRDTDKNLDDWLKIIDEFDDAVELYNEASRKKTQILKKYLGFKSTKKKINGRYYRQFKDNFVVIIPESSRLKTTTYHFGENWNIYYSNDYFNPNEPDVYEDIARIEYPEYFV